MDFDRCSEKNKNRIITASENKMKFTINNPHQRNVRKVWVDGCLINDTRERCDFLFEIDEPCSLVYYLELKGCHIEKAISQLIKTLGYCKNRHKSTEKKCHIVASRVPKAGTKSQVLRKKFAQQMGCQLFIGTQSVTVSI